MTSDKTLTNYQVSVKRALDLLCATGQKQTADIRQAWMIALNDCEPKYIDKATDQLLREGHKNDFLIKTDKFRAICLKIKHTEKVSAETKQDPFSNPFIRNKEISTKEARRIQEMLRKGMPVFNKIPCPKIDMVEYLNPDGDIIKIVAQDHVDMEVFEKNCANQFFVKLEKSFHGFHREESKTSEITGKYKTMAQCASGSGGSPITIGIV